MFHVKQQGRSSLPASWQTNAQGERYPRLERKRKERPVSDKKIVALSEEKEKKMASSLPQPCSYHILVALPEQEEKTDGGIYLTDGVRDREELASITAYVMALGPDCYTETSQRKFPSGAYCKEGDWVVMRAYSGTRIEIHGKKFRLITDDVPQAVVDDPRGVIRA
jgi:co-chaperonin GroES (HSP10)|tara:strand:- start:185 stop:682 length:498 start_codon:yes stop_codon:yes gene_type:complete